MATKGDAGPVSVLYAGPSHQIVRVRLSPSLSPFGVTLRRVDWAGLVNGRWQHPVSDPGLFGASIVQMNFGLGNVATRLRFGNPNFTYPVFGAFGQLRLFDWPIPYGPTGGPQTRLFPTGHIWQADT